MNRRRNPVVVKVDRVDLVLGLGFLCKKISRMFGLALIYRLMRLIK